MQPPLFTLCPKAHNAFCSLGSLPANQALELVITDKVRSTAAAGREITLLVSVSGTGLSPATASITTLVAQLGLTTPTSGSTPPPETFPSYTYPSTTVTPGSLSGLFPTVTPSASAAAAGRQHHPARRVAAVTSSALPLDPRLVGGQLAGLAVLAAAITMVVVRLSLRTPQAASTSANASSSATRTSSADPVSKADAPQAPDTDEPAD